MENEYYTTKEVATMLRSTRRTVYNWINDGKLNAIHISHNKKLIPKAEMERFLNERKAPPNGS